MTVRTNQGNQMGRYLENIWFKVGLALVVFGWGPLIGIIVLAAIGLWPDPDPNPIGPGLLFFLTSWPAIICLLVGAVQARNDARRDGATPRSRG